MTLKMDTLYRVIQVKELEETKNKMFSSTHREKSLIFLFSSLVSWQQNCPENRFQKKLHQKDEKEFFKTYRFIETYVGLGKMLFSYIKIKNTKESAARQGMKRKTLK